MIFTAITILVVIASILLICVVLIQNSKGGGLSANLSASNQLMGVQKTTDFIEKATWALVAFIVVMSVFSTKFISSDVQQADSEENIEIPASVPDMGSSAE